MALASAGRLRIPPFQRPFVWDAGDVRDLFDSVWRGFPLGTLLLWERVAPAGIASFGSLALTVDEDDRAYWVVDGQQRIASIVAALHPAGGGLDPRFEIAFDLRSRQFRIVSPSRGRAWWLPVRATLDTKGLLAWTRSHLDALDEDEVDLADAVGGALRDYRVNVAVVAGDDEGVLRELFDRVNGSGKRLKRAQVFHALFARGGEPGSTASVVSQLDNLGFGRFDEDRVVQSLLAVRGGDVQRDLHDEFGSGEDQAEWFDLVTRALERTVAFLRSQDVPHLLLVPSAFPLPVLAAFFHLHHEPEPWNLRLLARWLWRGWADGFGPTGGTPSLRRAVQAVNPVKGGPVKAPTEYDAVARLVGLVADRPPPAADLGAARTNTAAGRLVLLALAGCGPLRQDGTPIDVAEVLSQSATDGVRALVPGRPASLAARAFWPLDADRPTGREDRLVLASHAIPPDAARALANDDIDGFLALRGAELDKLHAALLERRLEHGQLVRPPLGDLVVADGGPTLDLGVA